MCRDARKIHFGFTLVELLVVLAIIATLLAIVTPKYFNNIDKAKEAVLRENLYLMREAIGRFYEDQGAYPRNIEELASHKYLRSVPVDPITGRNSTWIVRSPEEKQEGVFDIHSGASGTSSEGTAYSTW